MVAVGDTTKLAPEPIEFAIELPQLPANQYVVPIDPVTLIVDD